MATIDPDACAHFVDKWHRREPEMQFAEVFCPPADKAKFRAWGALLHELREALFELSDARVTGVKTAWWAEELIGLSQGRQRHPLTAALLGSDVPWSALGRALIEHDASASRAADTEQAILLLQPTAAAVVAMETAIFASDKSAGTACGSGFSRDDSTALTNEAARSLAIHWLLQRLPNGLTHEDQAQIPMHLFARHGITAGQLAMGQGEALLRDWGRELGQAMPAGLPGAALIRRCRHRFDQARLARLAAGKGFAEPPAFLTHWRAWRAARSP